MIQTLWSDLPKALSSDGRSQCQVDVHIHEKAGISLLDVKGGLNTNALANAVTKTLADKEVRVGEAVLQSILTRRNLQD